MGKLGKRGFTMFGRTLRTRMLAVFSALTVAAVFAAALAIGATAAPRQAQAAESQMTLALTAQAQKGVANVMIFNTVGKAKLSQCLRRQRSQR